MTSFQGVAQNIEYKINRSTNKISSLNSVFRFYRTTTYDSDFKEFSKKIDIGFKVSIQLNENGTGKMVMAFEDSEKFIF